MRLLTDEIRKQLPPLGFSEGERSEDKTAVVKFFTPDSSWTWYACEFDGEDLFYGYVVGLEREWGYFSLRELSLVRGPLGLPVERDLAFEPQRIGPHLEPGRAPRQGDSERSSPA